MGTKPSLSLESTAPASEGQPFVTTPVEAGLAERLRTRRLSAPSLKNITGGYRPMMLEEMCACMDEAALALQSQSAEIARSEQHRNDLVDKIVSQQTEIGALKSRITTLETADRENTELLEAAIEGQSYWQARAEKLSEALEAILKVRVQSWENIWAGSDRCHEIARSALADAQPTQGEGK